MLYRGLSVSLPDTFGIRCVEYVYGDRHCAVYIAGLLSLPAVAQAIASNQDVLTARDAADTREGLPYRDYVRYDLGGVTRSVYRRRLRSK